jgi:uncharacterized membrane protein YdfJ with MMPL/SSD domain
MQRLMLKLDDRLQRHRALVLITWIGLVALAIPLAMHQSDHLTGGGYAIAHSASQRVDAQARRSFPGPRTPILLGVLVPRPASGAKEMQDALDRLSAATHGVGHVSVPAFVRKLASGAIKASGAYQQTLVIPLEVTVDEAHAFDVAIALRKHLKPEAQGGKPVAVHLLGETALWAGLQDLTKSDLTKAERIGIPVVALILIAVFGSLTAAALPLVLGIVAVLITGAIIYLLSLSLEMSIFVTNMASMIGIGVAVDYSLFVLARYREEIAAGASPRLARARALATSGVAVTFSGLTVLTSLVGLFLVHATAIRSMALGAIIVVAISVLGAATLLPAVISLLGGRLHGNSTLVGGVRNRWRVHTNAQPAGGLAREGFWQRWAQRVTRRPVLAAAGAAALLLALAAPALKLHTVDGALHQFPKGNETLVGFQAAEAVLGPGRATPLLVVAPKAKSNQVALILGSDPEVQSIEDTVPSEDRRTVLLRAVLRDFGESARAREAVRRLRRSMPAGVLVGGVSAALVDYHAEVNGSMWKVALFVMGMSFILLLVLLRSIVLPIKAMIMNLLSVSAAYGVLELVFGTTDTLTPLLVLAVVFGLSMDYEVFLLSRIRERYTLTRSTRLAVAQGLSSSAGTISSAALIMVCVFSAFALTGVPSIQELGLGCAVAIAVDATVVRLVLVPAAIELLGRWNWWLPGSLARILPDTSIEGFEIRPSASVAAPPPEALV